MKLSLVERQILATPGVIVRASPAADLMPQAPGGSLAPCEVVLDRGRLRIVVPVRTASEVNARDWRARSRRTDAAWKAVSTTLGPHLSLLAPFAEAYHQGTPLRLVFTRMGGRRMDRSNLPTAVKATEDAGGVHDEGLRRRYALAE